MKDTECVEFLQWALPRRGLRWQGFRKVRRQVCKRIQRRIGELGLPDADAYRAYLEANVGEWAELDRLCRITMSRFYRDRGVYRFLEREVLPSLARDAAARGEALAVWSAGCASGEEPYTVALVWRLELAERFPELELRILATDVDPELLERAHRACYPASSLRELPERWRERAFVESALGFCLKPEYRRAVELLEHDVRSGAPAGPFDIVLCRNLVFTYFDEELQRRVGATLVESLRPGGALVVGAHERPPETGLEQWPGASVYRAMS